MKSYRGRDVKQLRLFSAFILWLSSFPDTPKPLLAQWTSTAASFRPSKGREGIDWSQVTLSGVFLYIQPLPYPLIVILLCVQDSFFSHFLVYRERDRVKRPELLRSCSLRASLCKHRQRSSFRPLTAYLGPSVFFFIESWTRKRGSLFAYNTICGK